MTSVPTSKLAPIEQFAARSNDTVGTADGRRAALIEALALTSMHDATALHAVYRMTHVKLEAVCLTVCFDYQVAQDALQDTYIAVWRNAAQFDATRVSPITWLVRIARNKAIGRLRKRKFETPLGVATIEEHYTATALNPEQLMASPQSRALANASVDALELAQAALVRAIYSEGLSYPQLAARSGLPLASVKGKVR